MLDLGLSKLAIIGVVALVVIGPEKLPRVARTAGALLGRAQRYINDVKSEVSREMDMGDLRSAKSEFEDAARNMHTSVHDDLRKTEDHLNDTWRTMSPEPAAGSAASNAGTDANPSGYGAYEDPKGLGYSAYPSSSSSPTDAYSNGSTVTSSKPRRNWRVKQSTPPVWFKRTQLVRSRLQSGAARVARHRPESLRQPTRFL